MLAKVPGEKVMSFQILPIGVIGPNCRASTNARHVAEKMTQVVDERSPCFIVHYCSPQTKLANGE